MYENISTSILQCQCHNSAEEEGDRYRKRIKTKDGSINKKKFSWSKINLAHQGCQ